MHDLIQNIHDTSWQEWIAAVTALVSVWLTVKNHIHNWTLGIVSVLFYGWVFWKSHYYASMGLNLFYFLPMQLYGWWLWAKLGPQSQNKLPVTHSSRRSILFCLLFTALFTVGWGFFEVRFLKDATLPFWDAGVTGLSIAAQFLDAKKKLQSWFLWIGVNIICTFYLYPAQKLYVTSILYFILLLLAFYGAKEWRKLMAYQKDEEAQEIA